MPSLNPAPPAKSAQEQQQQQQQRLTSAFQGGNDKRLSSAHRAAHIPTPIESKKNSSGGENSAGMHSSPIAGSLGVGRRNIVLDAKRNPKPRSGRKQPLESLPHSDKLIREEAVRCYKRLCEEIGQVPQENWIVAVLGDEKKGISSSGVGNEKVSLADSRLHTTENNIGTNASSSLSFTNSPALLGLNTGGGSTDTGGIPPQKLRRLTSGSKRLNIKTRPTPELRRSNSAPKKSTGNSSSGIGVAVGNISLKNPSALSSIVGMARDRTLSDSSLEYMVAYCQHLQPYSQKMELLKRRRQEANEAFENFLNLCRNNQQISNLKGSNLSVMTTLESHANALTEGLKEMQRCNVALLLRLADYSREVKRPLGCLGNDLDSYLSEQQQEQLRLLTMTNKTDFISSSVISRPQGEPHTQTQSALPLNLNIRTPIMNSLSFPSPKDPPLAYLEFLKLEERHIVQELNDMLLRIRNELSNITCIVIADESILETPLFIPSIAAKRISSAEKEKREIQQRQYSGCNSGHIFYRSSVTGSAASSIALSINETTGNTRDGRGRSTTSTKSLENKSGKITQNRGLVESNDFTPPADSLEGEESENQFPYVGVALMGWPSSSPNNNNEINEGNFHRVATGNPTLVLGGGRRCISFHSTTLSCNINNTNKSLTASGGVEHLSRSKSAGPHILSSSTNTNTGKRRVISKGTTTTTIGIRKSKGKINTKMSQLTNPTTDVIAAVQIREAERIWEIIKGLAIAFISRELQSQQNQQKEVEKEKVEEEKQQQQQRENQTSKRINSADFRQTVTPKSQQTPLGKSLTPKSVEKSEGKDIKYSSPKLHTLLGNTKENVEVGKSIKNQSNLVSKQTLIKRKQAALIIIRFLRQCKRRKDVLINKSTQPPPLSSLSLQTNYHHDVMSNGSLIQNNNNKSLENSKIRDNMSKKIACCWRQYIARKKINKLKLQVEEEEKIQQKLQYENIMANRIKRFFIKIISRRKRREALKNKHTLPTVIQKEIISTTTKKDINNKENSEKLVLLRERFEKGKEKRRNLLRTRLDSETPSTVDKKSVSSTSTPLSLNTTLKPPNNNNDNKKQKVEEVKKVKVDIPPLSLKTCRISTFTIENYHPEDESFEVGVLHRLLRAPKPVLYTLRVMCDRYPPRPESALTFLSSNEDKKLRKLEKCEEEEEEEAELHDNDEDINHNNKMIEKERKKSINSLNISYKRNNNNNTKVTQKEEKLKLEIRPYRTIRHHIFKQKYTKIQKYINPTTSSFPTYPPLSIRITSFVEENEIHCPEPISKTLQRPFECWGAAHSLLRRLFSAAAIYAWKLIFSHTPHDDYKQRMLKTVEEQKARLERVEQRNRMILACYCVRSEKEWLKEASKDIGFVAHIWNPKESLDPNDPDFEQHCHETYKFVEDFLYQCFPTLASLEDVPTFLMGAGIFFMLKSVLSYSEEDTIAKAAAAAAAASDVSEGQFGKRSYNSEFFNTTILLNEQQRQAVFVCELLNLLDSISNWYRPGRRIKEVESTSEAIITTNTNNNNNNNNNNKSGRNTIDEGGVENIDEDSDNWEEALERTARSLAASARSCGSPFVSLLSSTSDDDNDMGVENNNNNNNNNMEFLPTDPSRVRIIKLPPPLNGIKSSKSMKSSLGRDEYNDNDNEEIKSKEKGINKKSLRRSSGQFALLYPRGYLVDLSEKLVKVLLGISVDLEVCEDIDAMM